MYLDPNNLLLKQLKSDLLDSMSVQLEELLDGFVSTVEQIEVGEETSELTSSKKKSVALVLKYLWSCFVLVYFVAMYFYLKIVGVCFVYVCGLCCIVKIILVIWCVRMHMVIHFWCESFEHITLLCCCPLQIFCMIFLFYSKWIFSYYYILITKNYLL